MPMCPWRRGNKVDLICHLPTSLYCFFQEVQSRLYYSYFTNGEFKAEKLGDLYKITKEYMDLGYYKIRFALLKKFMFFLWY